MSITVVLAGMGFLFGSGALLTFWRCYAGHSRKHIEIDMDIRAISARSDRNDADHKEILREVRSLNTALHELLVGLGERKPGAGINGGT